MAATDATAFPVKGEAYRLYFVILEIATGDPYSGGAFIAPLAFLFKDGATPVAATNAVVQIGTTGFGYVELTAAECNYSCVYVEVAVANVGAVYYTERLIFQRETATTTGSTPTDLYTNCLWSRQFMQNKQSGPNLPGASGTVTIYDPAGSAAKWLRSLTWGASTSTLGVAVRQ